jgi:hypothetical protein
MVGHLTSNVALGMVYILGGTLTMIISSVLVSILFKRLAKKTMI